MRILVDNKVTDSMLTVNEESTAFPSENMLDNQVVTKTYFEDYIDIDFGSAVDIDSIGLVESTEDGVFVQANSSASWGDPPFSQYITEEVTFISETYRYWRIAYNGGIAPAAYTVSGTDQKITSPDSGYSQNDCFLPCYSTFALGGRVECGDHAWDMPLATGPSQTITTSSSGTVYGTIAFGNVGAGWDTFASSTYDGIQRVYLPQAATNDKLGGYFDFYYKYSAFLYAFNGSFQDIIISQNQSVYITSITNSNLVVRWDGQVGPAGSATPDVTEDIEKPGVGPGSGHINQFYLGEYMQLDALEPGSEASPNATDSSNISASGQIYTTPGLFYINQSFRFPIATSTEYPIFNEWFQTDDRTNNHFIVPFELDTPVESFYGKILDYQLNARDKLNYDYSFSAREAK